MDFYIVLCKTRKKFDKYVKINAIKKKVIIDINEMLIEEDIDDLNKFKDYFNILVYTRISHSLRKGKDIFYIPNFNDTNLELDKLFELKNLLNMDIKFNILIFYSEFDKEEKIIKDAFSKLNVFKSSQIIEDY